MMAEAGYVCLILIAVLGTLGCIVPGLRKIEVLKPGPWLMTLMGGQCVLILSAFLILLIGTFSHQWSWITVVRNSHTDLSWLYMLASTWSSPEGSFLVWLAILYGALWLWAYTTHLPHHARDQALSYGQWVVLGSALCELIAGHPFQTISQGVIEGQGLNPLLDHPYIIIHPPFLYIGYSTTLPLLGLACLTPTDQQQASWIRDVRIWSLISWAFLTAGIALGSAWAYTQLGWGGWWFWDPVENMAFIAWLLVTGLIHMAQGSTLYPHQHSMLWIKRLCLIPFVMVQLGVWSVRSGILTSVHSFAQEGSWGPVLGVVSLAVLFMSLVPMMRPHHDALIPIPRTLMIQPWTMVLVSALVAAATWYPLIHETLFHHPVTIHISFYQRIIVPLCILVVWGAALGPLSRMVRNSSSILWIYLSVSGLSTGILGWWSDLEHLRGILSWGAATGLIVVTYQRWVLSNERAALGAALVHFGLALSVLGMAADSWKESCIISMSMGQTVHHRLGDLIFEEVTYTQTSRSMDYGLSFRMTHPQSALNRHGQAVLHYHPRQDMWTSEAAVFRYWMGDVMIIPETLLNHRTARLSLQFHPLINFIWCGALMMVTGAGIQIWRLKREPIQS